MSDLRSRFEKIKNISKRIKRSKLGFEDDMDEYHTKSINQEAIYDEMYVNGAWFMFQKLNK